MSSDSLGVDLGPLLAEDAEVLAVLGDAAPAPNELTLQPERGRMHIDYLDHDGMWCVTDTLTHEQRSLVSGPWTAEYDDSGYCVLLYHGEDEGIAPIVVSEFMRKTIWTQPDGTRVHIQRHDGKPDKERPFDSLLVTVKSGNLALKLGHLQAAISLDASVFLRPRSGSKVFIGLSSLYKTLRLDAYSGSPTKWIHARHKTWTKRLSAYFSSGFLCFATGVELQVDWSEKCLEQSL